MAINACFGVFIVIVTAGIDLICWFNNDVVFDGSCNNLKSWSPWYVVVLIPMLAGASLWNV